ncbi:MAG: BatA domain-containing protein, partial [Flavobacteriales bacterium]
MKFLYPQFLWGLSAIVIPVIIHLFNFRRYKRTYFSNIKFLQDVQQKTRSRSQLKHLLVLLARILAVCFLVLAFAQPYIPSNTEKAAFTGEKAIAIYIDNSFSMNGKSQNGRLLDIAKQRAIDIANSYKPTDKFLLLTNELKGDHQHLISRQEFIDKVEDIEISSLTRNISNIATRQKDLLKGTPKGGRRAF